MIEFVRVNPRSCRVTPTRNCSGLELGGSYRLTWRAGAKTALPPSSGRLLPCRPRHAAGWAVGREFDRWGWDPALASTAVVWAAVGGLLGARLWIVVDAWDEFVRAPLGFLLTGGGFVFYGALLGGALAITIFFRREGIPWLRGADAVAPAIVLGQAIGRIGCQLAGDGD